MYNKYLSEVGTLLPGEGARILSLVTDVLSYINSSKQYTEINNDTANIIFDIAHRIMLQKHSLIDETVSIFDTSLRSQTTGPLCATICGFAARFTGVIFVKYTILL